ncbi:MAG TPA: pseudouridine-5'-phosphate glycosidase, partial [Polyangia bacterium]|nr:pseudouridine-5'-phosphate glycosidase [Polyangia bacterium]
HTGLHVAAIANTAGEIASAFRASRALGRPGALLVVQPPPAAAALDAGLVEEAVSTALTAAATAGVSGAALTPFLLAEVERATGGRSLAANLALLEANAALAAEIAVALADSR